jgi:hypothetical protein
MASGTYPRLPEATMEHEPRRVDPHELAIVLLCRLLQEDEVRLAELARRAQQSATPPRP